MDEGYQGRGGLGRVMARGGPRTVWLVAQDDGSWLIEGVGERPVRLTREVMIIVTQSVLRREEGRGA